MTGLRGAVHEFQLTAEVQPGNSGGPVVDYTGSVVGVVRSKLDALRMADAIGDIPQNINFAIRAGTVKLFLSQMNVDYELNETREKLDSADLAALASEYTILVQCD